MKFSIWNELQPAKRVFMVYKRIWWYPNTKNMLMEFRNRVLEHYNRSIKGMKHNSLEGRRFRWDSCKKELRDTIPYYFLNFIHKLSKVSQYVECIKRSGRGWLGLRLKFLLVWLPTYRYQHPYHLVDKLWEMEIVLCQAYKEDSDDTVELSHISILSTLKTSYKGLHEDI